MSNNIAKSNIESLKLNLKSIAAITSILTLALLPPPVQSEDATPQQLFTLPNLEPEIVSSFVTNFNSGAPSANPGVATPPTDSTPTWTGAKQSASSVLISEVQFKRSSESVEPESFMVAVRVEDGKVVLRHSLPPSAELRGGVAMRLPLDAIKTLILEGQRSSSVFVLMLPVDNSQRSAIALCPSEAVLSTLEGDTGTINPAPFRAEAVSYAGAAEASGSFNVGLSTGFGRALVQVTESVPTHEIYEDSTNSSDIEVDIKRPLIKGEFLALKEGRSQGGISSSSELVSATGARRFVRSLHATYISPFILQNRGKILLQGSAVIAKDLNCTLVVAQHLRSTEVIPAR